MASLIKGQILKHLSKFVKNLSPSQINLSTMRGEGELTDLELNEVVLTELLELPTWMRLTKASCNRAAIRIQWTKLKTVPIQLQLDEIRVNVETCDELRSGDPSTSHINMNAINKGAYGFTDKVVDGITVSVNLVYVTVSSLAFTASFQMSRIVLESRSPAWQKANLQLTRLKDVDKGEVLIFKEVSWQTVRIEAKSTVSQDLTPLRLITNQARCRMTIKKRMSDCTVLGVRLVLILDDLLWVLTDDQLKAALHFMDSISGLIKKATATQQKEKAARKLDNKGDKSSYPKSRSTPATSAAARTFQKYDVVETSYHFYSDRIDLHFCDDPGGGRSSHPDLAQGGAFQVSLSRLQMDYYPYHLARGDRKYWVRYSESPHKGWLHSNLASFDTRLLDVMLSGRNHTPLSRAGVGPSSAAASSGSSGKPEPEDEAMRDLVVRQLSRLMTENFVVRLQDISVWCVATSSSPSTAGTKLQEMVKGDHARLHLPPDIPLLHFELTSFYYPGDLDFPLPPPVVLVHMNPVTVWVDVLTLIWSNAFMLNLMKSVQSLQANLDIEQSDSFYADIKLEILMPRIICGSRMKPKIQPELKPKSLQIQASKISLSNYRSLETGSRADLATVLELFQQSPLFFGAEFPSRPEDVSVVCQKFVSHAIGTDTVKEAPTMNAAFTKDLLWTDARDMWYLLVDSLWAEFEMPRDPLRPVALIDAVPLAAWVYTKPTEKKPRQSFDRETGRPHRKLLMKYYLEDSTEASENAEPTSSLHVLAHTTRLVSLQLDHHQLIFLLRLAESLSELSAFLSADTGNIEPVESVVAIGAVLPQLDVSIMLPAIHSQPEPEHIGAKILKELNNAHLVLSRSATPSPQPVKLVQADVTAVSRDSGDAFRTEICATKVESVIDHSDPLSSFAFSSQSLVESSVICSSSTPAQPSSSTDTQAYSTSQNVTPSNHGNAPSIGTPSLKLSLAPSLSCDTNHRSNSVDHSGHRNGQEAVVRSRGITSSFNSLMDSMGFAAQRDTLLMPGGGGSRSPDQDLDTLSVRSDESAESSWDNEGFVVLGNEEDLSDALFTVQKEESFRNISPAMEMAEDVMEATDFIQNMRIKTLSLEIQEPEEVSVSVITLHLGRIQLAQLSGSAGKTSSAQGDLSSVLVCVGSVAIDPLMDVNYKLFQQRFCQSGKRWSDSTLCPLDSSSVKLRLDSRSPVNPHLALKDLPEEFILTMAEKIAKISDGSMEAKAQGLSLSLVSSTLNRLATWAQDEVLAAPLPLLLALKDIHVVLEDDAPPPPGVPAPPPLNIHIPTLKVSRDKAGTFSLSNESSPQASSEQRGCPKSEVSRQLELARTEIQLLREQQAYQQQLQETNNAAAHQVQTELVASRRQVADMITERDSLLNTLNYLQQELLKSGKK